MNPVVFSVDLEVRWRDLDAFNHVNNSTYLSYLEEARLRWMMGLPGEWLDDQVAPVVAASTLNYRRPIEWPNDLVVELFVERVGNSSVTIGHRIIGTGTEAPLYCDGNVVLVWIDRASGQAAPLPAAVRASDIDVDQIGRVPAKLFDEGNGLPDPSVTVTSFAAAWALTLASSASDAMVLVNCRATPVPATFEYVLPLIATDDEPAAAVLPPAA